MHELWIAYLEHKNILSCFKDSLKEIVSTIIGREKKKKKIKLPHFLYFNNYQPN